MKLIFKLKCAFAAAKAAFAKPDIMVGPNLMAMATLYETILSVQANNCPRMIKIGIIMPENEMHNIATVWVGPGANSDPVERIRQLNMENEELKTIIKQYKIHNATVF